MFSCWITILIKLAEIANNIIICTGEKRSSAIWR